MQGIRDYVTQGRELGLTAIPDFFSHGEAYTEDLYGANEGSTIYTNSLMHVAHNPIRFTSPAITYFMEACTTSRWRRQDGGYVFDAQIRGDYQPEQREAILHGILLHAARASQRNDSNRTVVASESQRKDFSIQPNNHGQLEVYWPTKYKPPIRRIKEGETPPAEELVSNRRRNKCPIGYTEQAVDPMPIRSIYEAVITYLIDANLHDPTQFIAPKTIGESMSAVR